MRAQRSSRLRGSFPIALGAVSTLTLASLFTNDARACGGCFHGTAQNPETDSVVTDHRMVLALGDDLTTLWDQVEYAGDPGDFAWVLPIHGAVTVGVGTDAFVDALDQLTAPIVDPPPTSCGFGGVATSGGVGCGSTSATASPADQAGGGGGYDPDTGVYVTNRTVVGPYDTAQIHGSTGGGIVAWLTDNGYAIPASIQPMLTQYVAEGFDFLAVRLRPDVGVQAMQPIRVSWLGSDTSLPLRMIAAGVGATVGLKLLVIGEGRWTTQNFPSFSVPPASVTWDFATDGSDYGAQRDAAAAAFNGRAFALESSIDITATTLLQLAPGSPYLIDGGAPSEPYLLDSGAPTIDATIDVASDAIDAVAADVDDASSIEAGDEAASEIGDADVDETIASDDAASEAADAIDSSDAGDDAPIATGDATPTPTPTPTPTYDAGPAPTIDPSMSDVAIAYGSHTAMRVTRLRAAMPTQFLTQDLVLEADTTQAELARTMTAGKSVDVSAVCGSGGGGNPGNGCACELPSSDGHKPIRGAIVLAVAGVATSLARRLSRRSRS